MRRSLRGMKTVNRGGRLLQTDGSLHNEDHHCFSHHRNVLGDFCNPRTTPVCSKQQWPLFLQRRLQKVFKGQWGSTHIYGSQRSLLQRTGWTQRANIQGKDEENRQRHENISSNKSELITVYLQDNSIHGNWNISSRTTVQEAIKNSFSSAAARKT